jgi:excisionase family DNA binding protein
MTDRDLLTTTEACDYLRISRDTLRRLKPKREYVGARPRYRRAELDKVAKRQPKAVKPRAAA